MGIEDIPRIGKAIKAAKAAKALENADDVIHPVLILEREGVEYEFRNMSFRQADQIWFSKIKRAQVQGTEEKVDLPSELPEGRKEFLEATEPMSDKRTAVLLDSINNWKDKYKSDPDVAPMLKELEILVKDGRIGTEDYYLLVRANRDADLKNGAGHFGDVLSELVGPKVGSKGLPKADVLPFKPAASKVPTKQKGPAEVFVPDKMDDLARYSEILDKRAAQEEANMGRTEAAIQDISRSMPTKLEPGIYLDEDSGKYFRITKDGDMEPLE